MTVNRPERIVSRDGLDYRITSSGEDRSTGLVYLLVHGIGMSQRSQARLHDRLSTAGVVYSVDLPGFGDHRRPARKTSVADMAAGLGQALDEIGARNLIVVGHSMGAQWVVELGAARPDLVRGVVVIGPVADDRARSAPAQLVRLMLDSFVETPRANALVFADYVRSGTRWYVHQLGHMLSYPIDQRVAELRMPFLVLRGGRDPIAGTSWCRRLRDTAASGTMVVVPGGAHNVQLNAAPAVASAIDAFARATPPVDTE